MKVRFLPWLLFGVLAGLPAEVLPGPGSYPAPLRLEADLPPGGQVRYRFLETPSNTTQPWSEPLVLDALEGESRTYGLRVITEFSSGESLTKDYRYTVVRPTDALPTVQPEPGRYHAAIVVQPRLPAGWTVLEGGREVSFPLTLDAPVGQKSRTVLEAKGPSGHRVVWDYSVDRRDQDELALDILNPHEGRWLNAQTLILSFRGVDRVLWNYGDRFDRALAQEYRGPVLLDRAGDQLLTVAARSRVDGRWLEKTVRWTNGTLVDPATDWPRSGAQPGGVVLPDLRSSLVSWNDGRSWSAGASRVSEPASQVSRKVLSLQVRRADGEFRSVYWLDARPPEAPALTFQGGWNPRLLLDGAVESRYSVVWTKADGQVLDDPEVVWGPTGAWKVPDGVVGARVQAFGLNGLENSATIGFSQTGWSTPVWEPWDQSGPLGDASVLPLGGRIVPRPGFWPVYEVSDRPNVVDPSDRSPLLSGAFLPSLPWGSDRTLYVRFAWRDAGGLVGPGTPALAVRIDRIPPQVPDVVALSGKVLIKAAEGEEEGGTLWWAATPNRVAGEALSFQPYTGALEVKDLRQGSTPNLWLHARAQDRSGNSGPARLNIALPSPQDTEASVVQVDPDPAVGETAVEDGGVYPWSSFRLRALDSGRELWVGVSDPANAVPSDWPDRVQPWSGLLSRGIAQGERRSFLVYWNAKTGDGWAWPQPQALTLTLDLSAPAEPVFTESWPAAPLGDAWTLDARPGRKGDVLLYTFSLDGSLPADPVLSGEAWPGTRTWDAPPQGRATVRVRLAARSVSGLSIERSTGAPVVIDRTVPAEARPALEPFTYRASALSVAPPARGALVRYTLTTDGRLPEVPSSSSPLVPSQGLVLEGRPGESVLYRLRWRSFSASGIAGPTTDAYGVLIDRTRARDAASSTGTSVSPPLRLLGLPPQGVSSTPVILNVEGPEGLVRFEVREGVGAPKAVSMASSRWNGPLVLDPGVGNDRSFAVSLRAFSPEGQPLTEEVVYPLRIDRSLPLEPPVEVSLDPRRPEARLRWKAEARNPGESLFFRWKWNAFGSGPGEGRWLNLDDEAVFSAPGGALTTVTLEAYLKDEAGNVGPTVERSYLIDQNVVYLAPTGQGSGSRSAPLGSVEGALDRARLEGKSILFVAAGQYPVRRTLDLTGFLVYGGLGPEWEASAESARSLWTATAPFAGSSLLESGEGSWALAGVDLTTAVQLSAVVSAQGSQATVRNGTWTWSGAVKGWEQSGGAIDVTNLALNYTAEPQGTAFQWSSLEAQVRGLNLTAVQNQGGQIVDLDRSTALFQDLVLTSKRAAGFDGLWSTKNSHLTVDHARIQGGEGADRAVAFVFKDTDASFWNTEVALSGTGSNTGFQTTGGRLEVQKSSLGLLAGREFNQGLVLDHSVSILRNLELRVLSGAYQGGLTVDGGVLQLGASKVLLKGGGLRVWGAQFLSETFVSINDVSWTLETKTPGDLWSRERPWAQGSTAVGSTASGWTN